jgi:NADH:ubiquinone oxidoreductase subunit 5 (subunit L)/multisubunit Na+/H+ antiporter MnhA subunit
VVMIKESKYVFYHVYKKGAVVVMIYLVMIKESKENILTFFYHNQIYHDHDSPFLVYMIENILTFFYHNQIYHDHDSPFLVYMIENILTFFYRVRIVMLFILSKAKIPW